MNNFLVIDRHLECHDEGSSERERAASILFFHPRETLVSDRLKLVSLCIGVIDFARSFSSGSPDNVNDIQLQDKYFVFHEVEPEIWMVMVLQNPLVNCLPLHYRRDVSGRKLCGAHESSYARAAMRSFYRTFRLFYIGIGHALHSNEHHEKVIDLLCLRRKERKLSQLRTAIDAGDIVKTDAIVAKLADYDTVVSDLSVAETKSPIIGVRANLSKIVQQHLGISDVVNGNIHFFRSHSGFHFYPVDRVTYLSIQYFINSIKQTFPLVAHLGFIFDGHLIWHNFGRHTMQALQEALDLPLLRDAMNLSRRASLPFVLGQDGAVLVHRIYDLDRKTNQGPPLSWKLMIYQRGSVRLLIAVDKFTPEKKEKVVNKNGGQLVLNTNDGQRGPAENCQKIPNGTINKGLAESNNNSEDTVLTQEEGIEDFVHSFKERVQSELDQLESVIQKQFYKIDRSLADAAPRNDTCKYLYYSFANHALKLHGFSSPGRTSSSITTVGPPPTASLSDNIPRDATFALDRISATLQCQSSTGKTIFIKTRRSGWVIGKVAQARYLYVILRSDIASSLTEAQAILGHLLDQHFYKVFLL